MISVDEMSILPISFSNTAFGDSNGERMEREGEGERGREGERVQYSLERKHSGDPDDDEHDKDGDLRQPE